MQRLQGWQLTLYNTQRCTSSCQKYMMEFHPESKIPMSMQERLRKVCLQKASDRSSKTIKEAIYADKTHEHFDEALAELKTGSAPGPSRVTANMIKAWPRLTKIFIFKRMTNI
jgi:hypothetical protein